MPTGSVLVRKGVRVVQGTPSEPLCGPTLFLKLWKVAPPGVTVRTLASLAVVRPSRGAYLCKDLISEMESPPMAAIDKAVAIAQRGGVTEVYVNADLAQLARPPPMRLP